MIRFLAAFLAAFLVLVSAAAADDCVDYGDFLRRIGNAPTVGSARSVVVQGDLAFLADGDAGFSVIDLADPTQPLPLANLDNVGIALWLAVLDDHVFLVNNAAEFHVIDVGVPDRPRLVATLALPGNGHGLLLRPPYLLLAVGHAGLLIMDVGTPELPFLLGLADTPGIARGLDAFGDLVAVADETGLAMLDISSPQQPVLLGWTGVPGQAYGVDLDGATALVAGWDAGLEVYDVANPAAPGLIAQLPLPGVARHIQRVGDLAFLASEGLCVVDVAVRNLPRLVGKIGTSDAPISVTVAGELALVPTADGGLDVFDADPPISPPTLSLIGVAGVAFGVDTRGPLTAVGAQNLSLFDHTDPTDPILLGTLDFAGTTSRLAFADDLLLITVAGAPGRVLIVDVADPAAPVLAAPLQLDGFVSQMSVRGSLVYLADFFYGGLFVVDISDPSRPDLEATVPSRPFALQLAQVTDHLLVGSGAFGDAYLQVYDLADPRLPVLVDEISLAGQGINGLAVSGDHVFATLHQGSVGRLLVFDASDPAAMQQIASLPLLDELHEVEVDGAAAYVSTYQGIIHVIDVTDPATPVRLGETFLPDSAFVLALSDVAVHAAATDAGLALLPLQCGVVMPVSDGGAPTRSGSDPLALSAHPNPFNPSVSLSFTLTRGSLVSVAVYDVAGRHVADLLRGELAAGRHAVTWSGRDDAGLTMPSGVYLARIVGDGVAQTARLVLAR